MPFAKQDGVRRRRVRALRPDDRLARDLRRAASSATRASCRASTSSRPFAVKINDKVSVGVGVDMTYLNVELRQRVDLVSPDACTGTALTFAQLGVPGRHRLRRRPAEGQRLACGLPRRRPGEGERPVCRSASASCPGQTVDVTNGTIATTQISDRRAACRRPLGRPVSRSTRLSPRSSPPAAS